MTEKITASINHLESELTAHFQGSKQVFLRNSDTPTKVTQVAYGIFAKTDYCELHTHLTMEECFFFIKGTGFYQIDDQQIALQSGVFIRIPAGTPHRLEATSEEPLEYVYFGVATD